MSYKKVNFNSVINKPPTKENIVAQFLSGARNVADSTTSGIGRALGQTGEFIEQQAQTPEGRRLLTNIVGALTQVGGASPYIGAGIAEQAQKAYEQDIQGQKEQLKLDLTRQADIDAAVEQFRRKEEIKAQMEAPEKQRELQEEQKLEKKKAVNAFMSAQEVISGIDNLLKKDPKTGGKRFEVAVGPIEGRLSGMALPNKKGEKSFQINQEIKTLLAQKALNTITEMKNASRTGATGFGAMNEKELGLIEADIASLDPKLSDEAFEASLNRIKQRMQKVMSQIDITEEDRLSLQQQDPLGIL